MVGTPSGGEETKLGDVMRVSDLRPEDLEGVHVDCSELMLDKGLSGLSESGRRLRPAGRGRARAGVGDAGAMAARAADIVGGEEGASGSSSSSSSSSTRVWS